jgi:hypothetical protein
MMGLSPWHANSAAARNDVIPGAFTGLAVTVDEGHPCPVLQADCRRTSVAP